MNKEQREILIKRKKELVWKKVWIGVSMFGALMMFMSLVLAIIGLPLFIVDLIWLHSVNKEMKDIEFKLAGE